MLSVAIAACLLLAARAGWSQDSAGTDFWLGFARNNDTTDVTLTLFITGAQNTNGTVAIPGLAFSTPFSVTAGTVTSVVLPSGAVVNTSDVVQQLGIHVTAANEVTVYGLNRKPFTTDAFLGLPVDILGTDHIILSYTGLGFANNQSQFLVVGTVANTVVTITPSATTGTRMAGVPYNVNLNAGDAYLLGNVTNGADLTGTTVSSTAPIAVFGSHSCANVPILVGFCDHLVEQLPPTTEWGREFVTVPLATRMNGDTFRFLAANDGTTVSVNGSMVANLNRGQFHEQIIQGSSQISASGPILVAQYSNGTLFDNVTSDPFMMLIAPFEQFLSGYVVTTPASGFSENFINVVSPTAAVGSITLDGVPIPAASFSQIGSSAFSGAQVTVALGSHALNGPLPFGAFVYGFDEADSYGYPGGQSLAPIAVVTNVALTPKTSTPTAGTQQCLTAHVTDQNGQPVAGVRVDFTVTGAHPQMSFAFANASGDAQFCYTANTSGGDSVLAAVGTISDTATVDWQAAGEDTPTVTATGTTTATASVTATATATTTSTATNIPIDTATATVTPIDTATATITATATLSSTPTATNTQSVTTPTATRAAIPVISSPTDPAGLALIAFLIMGIGWALRSVGTRRPE